MRRCLANAVICYLVISLVVIGMVPRVEAGYSPSRSDISMRQADLATVQKALETKIVSERLEQLGFSSSEINSRMQDLNDEQLHQLALSIDEVKVGGDGLGVVIALLIIAILVVVLLQLTGHKVIIK